MSLGAKLTRVVHGEREVGLVLGDRQQPNAGELDHGGADSAAERRGIDGDPGLLAQLAGGRLGQGLAALEPAADRQPERLAAVAAGPWPSSSSTRPSSVDGKDARRAAR